MKQQEFKERAKAQYQKIGAKCFLDFLVKCGYTRQGKGSAFYAHGPSARAIAYLKLLEQVPEGIKIN
jgi:hypothetical protein